MVLLGLTAQMTATVIKQSNQNSPECEEAQPPKRYGKVVVDDSLFGLNGF